MKTAVLAWLIVATFAQAIEDFSVKAGGRELVVSVLSPPEGKLAKDPALLLTFAGERKMSLSREPYCKTAKIFLHNGHRAASFDLPGHGDRVDRFGKNIVSFKNALVEFNLTDDKGHTMSADGYEKGARLLLQWVGAR